jgi:hypothetical protein
MCLAEISRLDRGFLLLEDSDNLLFFILSSRSHHERTRVFTDRVVARHFTCQMFFCNNGVIGNRECNWR